MPTNQMPAARQAAASSISSSAITRGGVRPRERAHPLAHSREPLAVAEQRARDLGHASELGLRHDDRAAAALEVARVQRLVVGRRERIRDEDRRKPRGCELHTVLPPASARDRGAVGGAEPVEHRHEPVVGTRDAPAERLVVPLAETWSTGGPTSPNASTASSLSARAPASAPATSSRPSVGRPSGAERDRSRGAVRGIGRPTTGTSARDGRPARRRGRCAARTRRQPVREPEGASASDSAAGMRFRQAA